MSYDIEIVDPVTEEVLHTPDESSHYIRGGTYAVNGTSEMWLNITYNYSNIISKAFNNELGIKYLENKSASDAIPILTKAINSLGNDVDEDYWKPTEGNVKRALHGLLALCKIRPDGIIKIF